MANKSSKNNKNWPLLSPDHHKVMANQLVYHCLVIPLSLSHLEIISNYCKSHIPERESMDIIVTDIHRETTYGLSDYSTWVNRHTAPCMSN